MSRVKLPILDATGKVPAAQLPATTAAADGKVLYGNGAPSAGTGADGDSYVDKTNRRLYGPKAAGAWPGTYVDFSDVGDGKTLYGAGAPGAGTGANGDSYVDTTNNRLYGPKAAGAWPGTYIPLGGGAGSLPAATAGQLGVTELGGTPAYLQNPISTRGIDDVPLIGRSWSTRFISAEEDAAMFAFAPTNAWQHTTDANGITIARLPSSTQTVSITSGSPTVTTTVDAQGLLADGSALNPAGGEGISGSGIPSNTTILSTSIAGTTATITMSANATATNAALSATIHRELVEATILTKAQDLRDWELLVKYLPKSTTSASAAYARGYGCYQGPNNFWRGAKRYHTTAGSKSEAVESNANGANVSLTYLTDADTIQGVPRLMRLRKVGDAIFWKHWFTYMTGKHRGNYNAATAYAVGDGVTYDDGGGNAGTHKKAYVAVAPITGGGGPATDAVNWRPAFEPDWQYIRRIRPPAGILTGVNVTTDNPDIGQAGFGSIRLTGDVYEVSVVELVRRPDAGLIVNPALRHVDSVDGVPVYWYRSAAPAGGNTMDVVDVMLPGDTLGNPDNYPRKAFHLNHVVADSGHFWAQSIYSARHQGVGVGATRARRHPMRDFARRYRVTGWSKGLNIVNTAPSANACSATLDVYCYDREGKTIMATDTNSLGNYFWALGPDGPLGHGDGTWDWHFFDFSFTLQQPEAMVLMNPQVGFHDQSTGELWIADFHMAPVG